MIAVGGLAVESYLYVTLLLVIDGVKSLHIFAWNAVGVV